MFGFFFSSRRSDPHAALRAQLRQENAAAAGPPVPTGQRIPSGPATGGTADIRCASKKRTVFSLIENTVRLCYASSNQPRSRSAWARFSPAMARYSSARQGSEAVWAASSSRRASPCSAW